MKHLIYISFCFFIISCSSSRICNGVVDESLFLTYNQNSKFLEVGGSLGKLSGNVIIDKCELKGNDLKFSYKVLDEYGKENKSKKVEVFLFKKQENVFVEYSKLNQNSKIKIHNIKQKKDFIIVFRFNKDWSTVISKRLK